MSRNRVLGVVVVLILIAFGAWYAGSRMNGSGSPVAQSDQNTDAAVAPGIPSAANQGGTKPSANIPNVTKNSFAYILSRAGNYECFYDSLDGNVQHNNRVYIADGKMRGEFRTTNSVASLMVFDGSYLYSWQEGLAKGTRARLTSISQLPGAIPKDLTSGAIYGTSGENVSWDCHTWIKDAKMLAAPSYVKFQ